MRQDSTYRTVDELPNLLSKGQQQPAFKSVDELPDLKKKEPSEPLSKEPLDGGLDGTISTNKEPIPTIELYKTPSGGLVDDPFTRVKKSKDLSQRKRMAAIPSSGKAGEVFTEVPDEGSIKEAENITSELEGEGFGKDFIEAVSDMPEAAFRNPTTSKETLINLYGNNPVKFKQLTNEAKIKYAIQDAAAQKSYNELEGDKQRDEIAKNTGILEGNKYSGDERMPESMQQFYDIVRQKQELIDKNIDDPEQKKKYQGLLRQTYAPAISPESLDFKEEYQQSGLSGTIDINQYAGLKTLELFEPEKYKTYLNVVQDKIVPQWNVNVQTSPEGQTSGIVTDSLLAEKLGGQLSQLTINQRIGKEEVLRELSLMGANNEYDDLTSQQNDLKQLYKDAETDEQRVSIIAKSIENENRMKQLEQVELENDKKYPLTAKLKYENQVKEIVDDRGMGVGGFMYNRYAHGVGTGVDAVENLVTNIFGSEADKTKLRMKRIGEGKQFEADTYLPESERRTGSPVIIQASDELKKKAKEIINGRSLSSLSDEERQQLNNLVANNQSQIKTITNPEAGKSKNFLSKATGLSIAGFTADIGAFLTKMGMLQGVGLGAKAAEATTLFTDGYDAAYNKKISEGASSEDAHEYGILHGAVLSLMTKFGSKYETIMNTVKGGKSPLSKYIAGLSEKQWNKLSGEAEPLLKRVGKTVKGVAKEQGKMIGTFGVAAPTAASIADNVFYDENKSVEQIAKEGYESAKEMLIGSAGFIGLGLVKGAMKPKASPLEKMALWELGDNPELGIARIDEAVKKNEITAEEGTQKKEIIERVSKLIPQVPETTDKGKVLDDQQRIDYLYRLALKESYKEKSKILPEKQAEKVKQKALVIDKENQIELEGLTEKQANDRKDKLEKAISKVDDKGKPELSDKEMADAKAELEAIDNTIKKRKDTSIKEEELPDLSVPIEGTNEKGIPIGENVPAEVKGEPEKITQPIELSVSTKPADVQTDKGKMEGSVTDKIEVNDVVVALPEKGFVISDVTLNKGEEKGKGSGQEIYKKALDEYGTLYSSFPISEDAMRVQNKLVEKGIAKIETITLSDGTEIRKITKIKPTDVVPSNPTVQEGKPTDVVVDAKQQSGKDGVITPEVLLSNAEKNNDYEVLALKKQIEKGGIEGIRAKKKLDVITKVRNKEKLSDDEFIIATDADAQDVSDFKKLSNETAISRVESHRSDKPDVKIGNALTIATKMRIEKMVYDKTGEIVNSDAITLNELRDKIKSSTPKAEPQQSGKDVVDGEVGNAKEQKTESDGRARQKEISNEFENNGYSIEADYGGGEGDILITKNNEVVEKSELPKNLRTLAEEYTDIDLKIADAKEIKSQIEAANILESKSKPSEETKIPIPKEEGGITEGVVSKVTSETGGAKEPPKEPAEPVGEDGSKKDGITHAAVEELRKIIGEPEYEGKPVENHETLIEEAQKKIKENPNAANEVLDKMENNGKITNKDNAVIAIYKATIDAEIAKNPTPELLKRATRLAKALDASGTELGKALESRKLVGKEDSLTNFLLDKQAAQGTALTEKQVKDEAAKYTELKAAKEALEKQLEQEREQHAKDIAELGINKAKAKAKREAKKSDEEYKAERKASVDAAREALKKLREGGLKSTIPGALELQAIAPHVKDFFNSLASQGVDKLDNIITQVHAEFKDVLDGLTKKNILDIVAGDFDQKKEKTKNEKAANIRLLKREVDLLKELERTRKWEEKTKSETEKIASNRRIDELKKKIEEVQKLHKEKEDIEPVEDLSAGSIEDVAKYEAKLQRRIEKLNNDLKEGNYLKEPAKQPIFKKTRKAQILEDRVIDLENKIRHERSKDEYNKRSATKRAFDKVMEVLGIRRLVQSAVDISVPFRQGATMLSPRKIDVWAKGFKANLQSVFSPKKFERIMYEIRHDQQYHEMLKDNVVFNDLGSADPNLHNEDFRKSFIYDIPIISEPLKASNRSADAFLNVARYEMYKKLRRNLEAKGFTREADPKAFKYIGNWVMSMTGRGKMHSALEKPAMNAVLGNTFYGARLMASRFNLLNPVTYFDPRIPKEVRYEAMKDMAAFTTTMITVATALSYATGAKISTNPDDSDFLQLRYDDKVYDISGGLANYVRTGLRIAKAGYTKATGTKYEGKEATKNAGQSVLNFFRNKLSPNTAYGVDAFFGGRYGEGFDPSDIYKIYPMYTDDFLKAIKEEGGVMATSTVLIPNILGIGYGSYASKGQIDKNLDDLLKRNLRSDEMNNEKIYNYNEGGRAVTLDEFEKFADKRDAEIEKDIKVLYKKGVSGTKYEDLTPEQVADEIKYIKATATRQVKEELFGKQKKSRSDKKEQKNLTKEREEKYKEN